MNNRSWSASRGPAAAAPPPPSIGGDQWQAQGPAQGQGHGPNSIPSPKMQSIIIQAEEMNVPNHIRDQLFGLSGAKRKWFYRYLEMGCSHEEALAKSLERLTNPSGFKGGSLKWYDKYIASGCTEAEARAKVLEYKRNHPSSRDRKGPEQTAVPDDRGRKRPIDDNSYGGRAKEEPKKQRRAAELPPKRSFVMAVMSDKYPTCVLSKKQLSRIEAALVEEMRKGWRTSINFGGIQFLPGLILVTCIDRNSKKWLEHVVPNITVIQGIKLTSCPEYEIPATKGITVLVPRCADEPDKITTELLIDQNADLLSKTWQVVRTTLTKESNKVITITLSDKSLELLQKKGMTVSYRFSQLSCRLMSGKNVLKSVRVNYTEPRPPPPKKDGQSSEIDLTEEDSEEYISQLNLVVVDEVKGDDDENEAAEEEEVDDGEHNDLEIVEEEPDEGETAEEEHVEEDAAEEEEAAEGEPEESYEVEESVGDEHDQEEEIEHADEEENQHADEEVVETGTTTTE
ncbi:uncharacterized protein LOC119546361 isoform X2 [Drosophila subpulchrella]|nr:uncharacterized protein LOC119546361 isoform X2 [Drosophila subpulchrella]